MSTDQFSSTLKLQSSISDVGSSSDSANKGTTKMPDYSITIADVVLEAGSLRIVVDMSNSQEPPSQDTPYQSLNLEIILQEKGSTKRVLLSEPRMTQVSSSKKEITIALGSSLPLDASKQYQIEVHAEGTNKDGDTIEFNGVDGGTEFVQKTTVSVS